jgi:hypothetical protein
MRVQPDALELLDENDRREYLTLQETFLSPAGRALRYEASQTFQRMLSTLHGFVMKGDGQDAKRGLVAGIVWTSAGIAVNTQYLRKLTGKSKSYINGGFHGLGYETIPPGEEPPPELLQALPYTSRTFSTLRRWTIRRLVRAAVPSPPTGPNESEGSDEIPSSDVGFDFVSSD